MPWVHFHVTQYGTVTPCCQAPWQEEKAFGNINKQSIHEIWNGDKINTFRKNILNNKPDERCRQCYIKEQQNYTSLRQITNKKYNHFIGRPLLKQPVYFDIRFSNTCNLRCRMCGPWSSSSWYNDAQQLGILDEGAKPLTYAFKNTEAFFEELKPMLTHTEEFYFAGGEPLVMQEHYDILEELIRQNRTDVQLTYNTNFSSFQYKHYNALEIWKKFKKVSVAASLDASGQRGELLRKNLGWKTIIENRKQLLKEAPHIEFTISPTLNSYNLLHLPDFHKEWVKEGLIGVEDFVPTLLVSPLELNVIHLPEYFKQNAIKDYANHIGWIKQSAYKNQVKYEYMLKQFENVICALGIKGNGSSESFIKFNKRLDDLRQENGFEIFPELSTLVK